ncbi:flagellar hook-length control protein FliK [Pseudomonas sp. CFBP 13711]|uniref:flagellar hook-length control protein FliK n=1 Tax=unclassified Pseudomonas TaxID=196821 RepID=UPI001780A38D|nr:MULTISPECIES: flagellar hook-length control protein FliK [unclassified Pseudomonas]MBD8709400.1 flagellar hook-length control protein FliK [Pseudomonas sp. CFBP 13711]MBD8714436.1 flagellar hook-length control protein FliK [Pseudomonas sp. CFBP 13715]
MTGDIPNLSPVAAATALLRAGVPAGEVLKLMEPREGLLTSGQVASAEVVSLKQLGQDFQLLLKLTMDNGRQTTLPVSSSLPLTPGTSVNVAQGSADTLTISVLDLQKAVTNSLTSIDTRQLPAGTLLQGKVLTTQVAAQNVAQLAGQSLGQSSASAQPANYRSIVILLNTALAGTSLTVDSPQPLRVGSLLSAQVQNSQALNFVALPNRLDELALAQQLSTQQSRQGSLQGLITALQNMPPPAADGDDLSPSLRASIEQLLADLPDIPQMTTAKGVAQALNASGLFMESRLLAGQNPTLVPDMKANLLRLVTQLLPGLPGNVSYDAAAAGNTLARAMPSVLRSAFGTLGLVAPPSDTINFPLPPRTLGHPESKDDLEMLLKLAAGAISRLQSHQLGGLEQTRTNADGTQVTTWQLEIPMRNAHDIVPLQVKVQREETPERDEHSDTPVQEAKEREKLWRLELAFDLEPLGPLQVQAQLIAGSIASQLWAEREGSAELISSELDNLRARLVACGLNVKELECNRGVPPQGPRTVLEQRWIDENA